MENNVNKYGMTSWDDEPTRKNSGKGVGRDDFARLENGRNEIRTVGRPHRYLFHKFKIEGQAGLGAKISCAGVNEEGKNICPLCDYVQDLLAKAKSDYEKKFAESMDVQEHWYVPAIIRSKKRIQILDIGKGIFKKIREFNANPRWGNPELYDIEIVVNPKGSPAEYYTVNPLPPVPSPLTEEEVKMKVDFDMQALQRLCVPPTPQKVLERMKAVREKSGGSTQTESNKDSQSAKGGGLSDLPSN